MCQKVHNLGLNVTRAENKKKSSVNTRRERFLVIMWAKSTRAGLEAGWPLSTFMFLTLIGRISWSDVVCVGEKNIQLEDANQYFGPEVFHMLGVVSDFLAISKNKDRKGSKLFMKHSKQKSRLRTWILLRAELNVKASTELPQLASGFLFFV